MKINWERAISGLVMAAIVLLFGYLYLVLGAGLTLTVGMSIATILAVLCFFGIYIE